MSDLEEEVFYHHLFLLYTEVDICAKKNNLGCYSTVASQTLESDLDKNISMYLFGVF
ncbi:hypothetical protein GH733_006823 [Mirounga leonina]|nr:hypothetical protein GH733_006823 [Mirounga leonina]